MKALLDFRASRLFAQANCPQCNSHKVQSFNNLEGAPLPYAPPHEKCRAMIRFYCGAVFSIDEEASILNHAPCALASRFEADAMNIDADTAFEMQEQAA